MRVIVVVVGLVLLSRAADARVIRVPPVARECAESASWNAAIACLKKHGVPKLVKQIAGARIYRVTDTRAGYGNAADGYLLFEQRGRVRLGGMMREVGDGSVLRFANVTIARHRGFRVDVGLAREVSLDSGAALQRLQTSIYCSGKSYRCTRVVTSCEVLAGGKTVEVFRGKVEIRKDGIRLVGDRANAGSECTFDEEVFLDWPSD